MARLKIYTDENVDIRIAEGLRKRGITAFPAVEKDMIGVTNREHFKYAMIRQTVIFTHDHHCIEIAKVLTEEEKSYWGIISVDMNRLSVGECIKRLAFYAVILSEHLILNADKEIAE